MTDVIIRRSCTSHAVFGNGLHPASSSSSEPSLKQSVSSSAQYNRPSRRSLHALQSDFTQLFCPDQSAATQLSFSRRPHSADSGWSLLQFPPISLFPPSSMYSVTFCGSDVHVPKGHVGRERLSHCNHEPPVKRMSMRHKHRQIACILAGGTRIPGCPHGSCSVPGQVQ